MKSGIVALALVLVGCTKPYQVQPAQAAVVTVDSVGGDGSSDGLAGHASQHVQRAVILRGAGLEGASVTLEQDGAMTPLVTAPMEGGLEALLPVDVKAGTARLHVKTDATELERDIELLQGESGPKGDPGEKGDAGPAGLSGPQGVSGPQGPAGAMGPMGPAGPAGARGLQGDRGEAGAQGIQGGKGDKGDKGDKGATGDDGILGTDVLSPSGDTLTPEKGFEVIGAEKTVSLADDAYLTIIADVRAVGLDRVQPRDVIVGVRIAGDDSGDRTLRVMPQFDKQVIDGYGIIHTYYGSEARMTFVFKTADKVKSGNVKIALVARCGEAKATDCAAIEFRPGDQRILVTQLR